MREKNPEKVRIGRKSKRKGASGEREAASEMERLFPGASFHRGRQYHGGPGTPDVCSTIEGLHLEVKRVQALSIYTAMAQAKGDAKDSVPLVLHRKNNQKWLAIVELDSLPDLIKTLTPYLEKYDNEPSNECVSVDNDEYAGDGLSL